MDEYCYLIHQFILPSANLFSYSFHVPCIILSNVYFYTVRSDHSRKQVLLIKWIIFFWSSKIFFALFNFLEMVIYRTLFRHWSTLWNSAFKITTLIWLNLTLFNVVNFNVYIHNIVSTLIWCCPMSWKHITLTKTTLRQRWNVLWALKNIAKSLHKFVKFIKLKTYIFSRIPLNCCCKLSKRY